MTGDYHSVTTDVWTIPATTTVDNVTVTPFYNTWPYYQYRDAIRDWIEGFLADKNHLTKEQTEILKNKLGIDDS